MSTAEMFAHAYADMRGITLEEAIKEIQYRLIHEKRENAPRQRDAEKVLNDSSIAEW